MKLNIPFRTRTSIIGLAFSLVLVTLNVNTSEAISFPETRKLTTSDAPFMISLWNYDPDTLVRTQRFCSGVMLDQVTFLTAAHCLKDNSNTVVIKNQNNQWERGETLMIYKYVLHPRYSALTTQNDIAVGIVNFKARDTQNILSSTLADQTFSKKSTYIYGWGLDQNQDDSGYLRRAKLNDFTNQGKKYFPKSFNSKTMIAAGSYNANERVFSGACYGDSGGPLISSNSKGLSVIGITSFIKGPDCDLRVPTIFTRVSYYKDFISKTRKELLEDFKNDETVSPELDEFSLPWNTTSSLNQIDSGETKYSVAPLQSGGYTGAADVNKISFQTWKNRDGYYPFAINVFMTSPIEACIEKQKGSWQVQVSLSSSQTVDLQFRVKPGTGCYTLDNTEFNRALLEIKPPAKEGCTAPAISPWGADSKTEIDSFSFYFDKGCLGTAKKIWIRIFHEVGESGDIEPGVDTWAGPFPTLQPGEVSASSNLGSYTAALDKASYRIGEVAYLTITGKDTSGNLVANGTKLANSVQELLVDFKPHIFRISPNSSDLSVNGRWTYELIISSIEGIFSGKVQLNNLQSQTVPYRVIK
jgi:secreted trypsin-like serine protease